MTVPNTLGLALAGLILTAPLPTPPTVTFNGSGLNLGLSCASVPSTTSLTVPSGGSVTFVNKTGKTAVLWVGAGSRSLPNGGQVPVTFPPGPATVLVRMLPDCTIDRGQHVSMTVTVGAPVVEVTPSPSLSPTPSPSVTPRPSKTPKPTRTQIALGSPLAVTPPTSPVVAAPVFGTVRGVRRTANGLLVLIAGVLLVGVIVTAIRVVSRRR